MNRKTIKVFIGCIILVIPLLMYLYNLNISNESIQTNTEEEKIVKLYIATMKDVFKIENGGNEFIAIRKDSLKHLNDEKSKEEVLKGLKDLSSNVYWMEDVKENKSFFMFDERGMAEGAINGTVLSVNLKQLNGNKAVIEATSWFGNLGAVFPEYKAVYKNGKWNVKTISMAIS
jgi:hypothetical protein